MASILIDLFVKRQEVAKRLNCICDNFRDVLVLLDHVENLFETPVVTEQYDVVVVSTHIFDGVESRLGNGRVVVRVTRQHTHDRIAAFGLSCDRFGLVVTSSG